MKEEDYLPFNYLSSKDINPVLLNIIDNGAYPNCHKDFIKANPTGVEIILFCHKYGRFDGDIDLLKQDKYKASEVYLFCYEVDRFENDFQLFLSKKPSDDELYLFQKDIELVFPRNNLRDLTQVLANPTSRNVLDYILHVERFDNDFELFLEGNPSADEIYFWCKNIGRFEDDALLFFNGNCKSMQLLEDFCKDILNLAVEQVLDHLEPILRGTYR